MLFHLGKDCDMNLRFVKIYLWKTTGQFFRETEKLISGQTETTGISLINFQDKGGYRQAYCTVELINIPLPKSMSSPILCSVWEKWKNLVESWKKQIQWYSDNSSFSELNRIDGQLVEFEWTFFPGFSTVAILNEIQQMMGEL